MGSWLAPGKPARPGRFEHSLWHLICASFLYVASFQNCISTATLTLGINRFRELWIWVDRSVQGRCHNLKIGEGEGYNEGNGTLGTWVLEPNKTWLAPYFIV